VTRPAPGMCALTIMITAPRAGHVKTRLVPPLTLEGAAELQVCFLKDTADSIAALCDACHSMGIAVYTPEGAAPSIWEFLPPHFSLLPQRGDGQGERPFNAGTNLLAGDYASVCLIDSDSPTVPPAALAQAVALLALQGQRVVLGPADDGGYYLTHDRAPSVPVCRHCVEYGPCSRADDRARARGPRPGRRASSALV